MKSCEICNKNEAEVPDRNRMGRPIKRICFDCHRDRLEGDADRIVNEQIKNTLFRYNKDGAYVYFRGGEKVKMTEAESRTVERVNTTDI